MEKLWASVFIKVYPNTQMFLEQENSWAQFNWEKVKAHQSLSK